MEGAMCHSRVGGIVKTGVETTIGKANGPEGKLQEVVCNPVLNMVRSP